MKDGQREAAELLMCLPADTVWGCEKDIPKIQQRFFRFYSRSLLRFSASQIDE